MVGQHFRVVGPVEEGMFLEVGKPRERMQHHSGVTTERNRESEPHACSGYKPGFIQQSGQGRLSLSALDTHSSSRGEGAGTQFTESSGSLPGGAVFLAVGALFGLGKIVVLFFLPSSEVVIVESRHNSLLMPVIYKIFPSESRKLCVSGSAPLFASVVLVKRSRVEIFTYKFLRRIYTYNYTYNYTYSIGLA